jgi:UDP-2,3-diacylglucosamine pyrophosphatase LpxH
VKRPSNRQSLRSVFISDLHLGSRGCRAERLLDFLNHIDVEQLFLVGDVVDLWSLKRSAYWPASHEAVLSRLMRMADEGRRVVLVPGNHDADLRAFTSQRFGNVEVHRNFTHRTAEGRRLLLMHGDEFDGALHCHPWLEAFGSRVYDFTIALNHQIDRLRTSMGYPYWSLAGYLKQKAGRAMQYVHAFEKAVVAEARNRRVDGVICGHIHRAALHEIDGVLYGNDGDWVENCSAIVERNNGALQLWHWPGQGVPVANAIALPSMGMAA